MKEQTTAPEATEEDTATTSVVRKLKEHKKANRGSETVKLPETQVSVTFPKFRAHAVWMKAQRLSRKNPMNVTNVYLALVCRFDGQKLTLEQFADLIPSNDVLFLIEEVMGDDESWDDEDEGNALR